MCERDLFCMIFCERERTDFVEELGVFSGVGLENVLRIFWWDCEGCLVVEKERKKKRRRGKDLGKRG